jgi:hypothetical protein
MINDRIDTDGRLDRIDGGDAVGCAVAYRNWDGFG